MSSDRDTITAIATPAGSGGLGIIRISGDNCLSIYRKLTEKQPEPRLADYVSFKTQTGELIDKGIAIYFKGPGSYTGEDVMECHIHGNPILLNMLLEETISAGARQALPGEFTERAFLNNKIDLVQAEAVADLIDSHSRKAVRSAIQSLQGTFSEHLYALKDQILKAAVLIEATLDFPDEEDITVDPTPAVKAIGQTLIALGELLDKAESGRRLHDTAVLAIVGPPNVGKSCIMNILSGHDCAIVSDRPGTTRDAIREQVLLEGNSYTLVDTAGLRDTVDDVEREGMNKTRQTIHQADLVLTVFDASHRDDTAERAIAGYLPASSRRLTVFNKTDLCDKAFPANTDTMIYTSAKTGDGIQTLLKCIREILHREDLSENSFSARARHINTLRAVRKTLLLARESAQKGEGIEIMAEYLRQALAGFDQLLGRTTADDILGEIFSRFCIGK